MKDEIKTENDDDDVDDHDDDDIDDHDDGVFELLLWILFPWQTLIVIRTLLVYKQQEETN